MPPPPCGPFPRTAWSLAAAVFFLASSCQRTASLDPGGADGDGDGGATPDTRGSAEDADGDGHPAGEDCDDADPSVHPYAVEVLDGRDGDCDGVPDRRVVQDAALEWSGPAAGARLGEAAVPLGDLDGDGVDDFALSAPGTAEGWMAGTVYVALGGLDRGAGGLGAFPCAYVSGARGDRAGSALAGGDIDGDGQVDLAVGAPGAGTGDAPGRGAVYVVTPGRDCAGEGAVALETGPWSLLGQAGGTGLGGVLAAGDRDRDGAADLTLGLPGEGEVGEGAVLTVPGAPAHPAQGDVAVPGGLRPLVVGDEGGEGLGAAVAVTDLDGDGWPDVAMGAPGAGGGGGAVFVLSGRDGWPRSGEAVSDVAAARWWGAEGDGVGTSLAAVGDVDGDGLSDLLVGAPGSAEQPMGRAWLVRGRREGWPASAALAEVASCALEGEEGERAGLAVGAALDTDGDGLSDLLVANGPGAGRSRVWWVAGRSAWPPSLALSQAEAIIDTPRPSRPFGVGDVDGDGDGDILVGDPSAGGVVSEAGAAWLFAWGE